MIKPRQDLRPNTAEYETVPLVKPTGFRPDVMFTSVLKRAKRTGALALDSAGLKDVPVVEDWRLNERHYGGLTGLNKAETAQKHGEDQV